MERWVVAAKRADFTAIGKEFGIDPVIARLIRNRDVQDREEIRRYLYGTVEELASPHLMKDVDKAVEILRNKIKEKKRIRIIGDYDIDGVVSTFILIKGLKRVGALADTYIPDRVADGYGIHEHLIERAVNDGIDVIVTCDNGIAAYNEIAMAKEKGITVIITDHHEIPYKETEAGRELILPPADAIVNPKQPDCNYPEKRLCGAVVALKLVTALYEACGIPSKELEDFLELGAIANKGLSELIRANGLEDGPITAYHVGFVLGPCINASGRLDTAARSLKLLCAETEEEAAKLAGDLTALNQSRKALTEEGKEEAIRIVEETEIGQDRVLVIYLPDCHESLAGIIAGRIREKYNKPVFVLTKGETMVKGSGRSIESYSMFEELVKCGDLMEQYGGHPMAAGLSIKEENVEEFRRRLNENCMLTEKDLMPKIVIDVPMPVSYINKELVEEISLLEPFGKGNTKPIFAQKGLRVLSSRVLGKNRNVAKLQLSDSTGCVIEAVYFGEADEFINEVKNSSSVAVTYYPEINRYQGRETLQIVIRNYLTE